ncbi:DMT family transporter [Mycobacterium sp. shizuoka-1]|uniref:DMT family transporter n=1 Tax=Mycobacterium sp. shizuoka-1 TaxID=2039281 RepID=UPI000C060A7B|nr:DMT family transporter [Mycobacterium sp. shizuoka-1]GAY18757.1 multidrug transporter [Mycobacterium sp. shizuoka-1]
MLAPRRVDPALLAVAALWGSSYLAAKDVATPDAVFGFLTLRFAVAAVGLAVALSPRLRQISRAEVVLGALFGAILGVVLTVETFGLTMTSASNAGLIISLTIVMTPLLQQGIQRTRLPVPFYGATAIAVLGVGLLTQSARYSAPGVGDLLMLVAAAARACHVVVMAQLSRGRRLDSGRVTVVQICVCLALFATAAPLTGRDVADVAVGFSVEDWLVTAYLALGCTVFAFAVQAWAIQRTSPARVSLLLGTEPLWAAGAGIIVAGDPLTVIGAAGAILVLTGTNWGRGLVGRSDADRDLGDGARVVADRRGPSLGVSYPSSSERASRRRRPRLPWRRWT